MADERYSIQRRIKQHKLLRKARRGEIFIRRIFKFFRFCLVLFLLYGLYRVANSHYWYFPRDMLSKGKNIQILGNSIVSNKKIFNEIQKVEIPYEPLYKVNPEKLVNVLEALPPIKRVYIRRFWLPARLVIVVEEVIPAITISPAENTPEVAAYSFDGEYISRDYLPLSNNIHAIKVLSYGTKDDDYENWDDKKIQSLYKLVKQIEHYSGEKVKYLDLRIQNNAFVQLQSVKIRLGVLDLNVYERIKALSSMLSSDEVKRLASKTKYIDLSWSQVQYVNIGKEDEVNSNTESEDKSKEENN